jgi:NAD(P)-dependent dehydrogenase (short-subunit alcohol dehydrogenase family)
MAGLMNSENPQRDHGWARTLRVAGSADATHHIRRPTGWRGTPLLPSTLLEEAIANFGKQVPMKRPGHPPELATAYVMLADPLSSYVLGATIAVTGGKPIL